MDVDIVVQDVSNAERAIAKAFPTLTKMDTPGENLSRYRNQKGLEVIDLMHPVGRFKAPLKFNVLAIVHGHSMRIASYEILLTSRYFRSKSYS